MADTSELREKIAAVIDNDAVIYEGGLYPVHVANTRDLATRILALPGLQAEAQAPAVTRERHFVIHSLAAKYGIERMALGNLLNEWHAAFPTTTAPAPVDALTEDERELVSRARALAPTIMQYGHRDDAANTVARAFIAIDRLAPTQESKP